jgi:hypothetical protein
MDEGWEWNMDMDELGGCLKRIYSNSKCVRGIGGMDLNSCENKRHADALASTFAMIPFLLIRFDGIKSWERKSSKS